MRTSLWIFLASLLLFPLATQAGGGDLNLKATLIWGCDDPMPKDPNIKPVPADVAEGFQKLLKWKHYYEVKSQEAKLDDKGMHKFVLSDKCTVEVANQGKNFEAKLLGEGKLLTTQTFPSEKGHRRVLAGPDKNKTAWFVVLMPQ